MHERHGEAGVGFLKRHVGCRANTLGRHAGIAELAGEGHRKAAGVGGGDQLFGIGALPFLEAGAERILRFVENAAVRGNG